MKEKMMKFAKKAAFAAGNISLVLFGIPFVLIGFVYLARFWAMLIRIAI